MISSQLLRSATTDPTSTTLGLIPHPLTPGPPSLRVQVSLKVAANGVLLQYALLGDLSQVLVPPSGKARRTDGLWRRTCFEAFAAGVDWPAYREFNFSPTGAWAAYDFRAYRDGRSLAQVASPQLRREAERGSFSLSIALRPEDLPPGDRLRLGLAAVVEVRDGTLSYWALQHPLERPDFHHADGFAVELPLDIGAVSQATERTEAT